MYYNRKCKITFVSHGATIFSEEERFSDTDNYPPLSEAGVEEIENLTRYFKARGVKNDVIYASPSVRTVQTAIILGKLFKKDYVIEEELTSRKYGKLNGLTYAEISKKFPGARENVLFPGNDIGAESTPEFIERVKTEIDALVEKNIGNRIIAVTYPNVIQAAICGVLDIPAEKISNVFIRTGSVTQISYFENGACLVFSDYVPL